MLDIGWTELLVIAIVLIVVVGPKDLPPMLRAFGKMTSNFRKMAGDFRAQFDEALREADMDDVRKTISDAQKLNPTNALRDAMNPLRQMGQDIKADLQKATQVPNPLQSNASALSETDIEAQQAIEGAEPASIAPEVPASVEPTAKPAGPVAPVAAAPVTAVTTEAKSVATASAANTASAETVAAAPAKARKAPATKAASSKTGAAKASSAKAPAAKAKSATARPAEVVTDASAKPKRSRAASKASAETASIAADAPAAKAPARKRAVKKTDIAKDEA
jgi:sec-independent protein translocase protein TatB